MNLNLVKMAREAGFRVGDQFAAGCSEDDLQKLASIITAELETLETPQRKPLTDEQWQVIADTLDCLITRKQKDAIEAVIGIKE